ncbi:MAG: right-handed parallel beta-helix repeat-containing protein [Candidatus Thermoplasmatota archaeon]|nr:right-handed parallel beta-helix repeat-containing protein [Candidatus Thermoplasmatota archaeon]
MKTKGSYLAVSALVLSALFSSLVLVPEGASAYTPHDPIEIDGNADFTAANGVVGGSGTPSDPYIIEGWEIDATTAKGINIRNTNAHFIIRNVYVHSGIHGDPLHPGIYFSGVNGRIENNNLSNNAAGIHLSSAINVTVRSNNFTSDGITIEGYYSHAYASSHTITQDNLVNGKPIHYHKNCDNLQIDGGSIGQLIIANCTNVRVSNLQINDTAVGIRLHYVENATIEENIVTGSFAGIGLGFTNNTTVVSNELVHNMIGLTLGYSDNITVFDVNMSTNDLAGISLDHFDGITLRNSSIEGNQYGILFEGGDSITVLGNMIRGNEYGIAFGGVNELLANHNDFIDNNVHVYPYNGTGDSWDNGYPSGGNYWSNYTGIDNCSGSNQDVCPDPDGIGDTPYSVDNNSQDRYPFMEPLHVEQEPPGNSPPECEIEHPVEGTRMHGTHAIEGTAHDEDGEVVMVEIRIDDESWIHVEGTTHWSYDWDTTNVSNGEYTIYARSYDGGEYSETVNVTVEVHNPTEEEMMYGEIFFWTAVVLVVIIALAGLLLEVRRRKKEES